jgi:hypothetical protein
VFCKTWENQTQERCSGLIDNKLEGEQGPRRIFGVKTEEETGGSDILHNGKLHNLSF